MVQKTMRAQLSGNFSLVLIGVFLLSACSASSGGQRELDAGGQSFSDQDLALDEQRFQDGNIPVARADGLFKDLLFAYNSSAVPVEYQSELKANAKVLMSDPSLRAEVEGHCDKRGTIEYNHALGEERAKAVAALLVSYGVRPTQLTTISYGEEIPVDPGDTEAAYSRNRRVHFALFRAKTDGGS
jgi:peptidoglycan-associated lipoprotein